MHVLTWKRQGLLALSALLFKGFLAQASAADAPPLRFDVMTYVVNGNTVLTERDIEKAVYPFLGPDKTVTDVEAARKALEKVFQDKGYLSVAVNLPVQQVSSGDVVLEVVEAPVAKLRIEGSQYHLPSRIADNLPSLAPGQVPHFPAVQADLAAIQQASPDLHITPLIAANETGRQIDVTLKVEDQVPVHGSVELNNKQTFNSRAGRLAASASYDNLFQRGHSIGLSWNYAPQRPADANSLSFNYMVPVGRDNQWRLSWTHSDTDTPTEVGGSTITKGDTVGLHWQHELSTHGDSGYSHQFGLGVDIKHNRDANRDVGANFVTEKPALRYPALVMRYNLSMFEDSGQFSNFSAALTVGTDGLGSRQVRCLPGDLELTDQFACKRVGALASFQALRLGWTRRAPLYKDWRLNLAADMQLASGPLASPEQFGAGGAESVRGYYDYEQVGDQGWTARAEVATPPWTVVHTRLNGLVFWDRAALRTFQAQTGQFPTVQMGSTGVGLRGENGSGLQLALDIASPIFPTYKVNDSSKLERTHAPRWNLSVKQAF